VSCRYNQLQQQSFNIQQVAFQHQQIKSTVETVAVMKAGMQQMKKDMKPLRDIGKLESMMDEMGDLMMDANEARCFAAAAAAAGLPLLFPLYIRRRGCKDVQPPRGSLTRVGAGARVSRPIVRPRR
jgi:hypothetical protein